MKEKDEKNKKDKSIEEGYPLRDRGPYNIPYDEAGINPSPIKEIKERVIKIKYNDSSEALNGVKPDNIFLLDEIDYNKEAVEDWANKMIKNSFTEELQERLDKEFLKYAVFGINPLTPEECFNKVDKSK